MAVDLEKAANDPSTVSSAYAQMQGRWHMISALMGGTETMRAAGETFLPRHTRERGEAYQERLEKAVLYNLFEITLDLLSGKPFTEPIKLGENMSETLVQYADDIDLQGNNLTRFCYEVFRTAMAKAFTHVLVDMPEVPDGPRSLADDREMGLRPYLVHIEPENLIFMETTRINGEEVITHLRFHEYRTSRQGFAEVMEHYIRVMDLVQDSETGETFVKATWYVEANNKKTSDPWVEFDSRMIRMSRIPLQTFYTNREGVLMGKPPLLDLAYLNIEHYQSYSDQLNILTVTRFPLLAGSGISEYDTQATIVGPRNMLMADDPAARFYYVEHTGAAISSGERHLETLEQKMSAYGASLLVRRPDRETASARAAAEESVTSPLQRMVQGFKDFLTTLFQYMAEMDQLPDDAVGTIMVKDDFADDNVDAVDLQTLQVAVKEKVISRRGFLEELKRKNVLSDDFDIDEDLAFLRGEIELNMMIAQSLRGNSDGQAAPDPADTEENDQEPDPAGQE